MIILILVILTASLIYYFMPKTIHISPKEFEYEYEQSKMLHTMKFYADLFIKDKYIYMPKKEMTIFHIWKKTTLYTEVDKVNKEILLGSQDYETHTSSKGTIDSIDVK